MGSISPLILAQLLADRKASAEAKRLEALDKIKALLANAEARDARPEVIRALKQSIVELDSL